MAVLTRVSALLGPSLEKRATDHGVACHFSTLYNPTVLDRLNIGPGKAKTSLSVQVTTGTITIAGQSRPSAQYAACDVHIRLHGKKEVYLLLGKRGALAEPYTFESRLFAVEFLGAVHLVQHMEALKSASPLPMVVHDAILKDQMMCTLFFAREMWTLAMWNQLYPYSGLVDSLAQAVELLEQQQLEQLSDILHAVYFNFHAFTAINRVTDANHELYYRASHMTLLVAKVKALQLHVALYMN
ncbi:hypothetical protein H310_09776 [Aphanomyces invadans]|uniref:Uncharacterized protein n=1 Tax=Aphanomyces invadans TaxID=157072 RepID=A0A024TTJ1_9STRA|nr:hypothetical protein H310_09776 [Aphanomyces invadans]ETV96911.1 hypothetical protein H310_09776 [Aphanomyces invadans]|eukprot:XP_008874157.1 hypothetical protein H310_09776 [Aphanomyces invadans]